MPQQSARACVPVRVYPWCVLLLLCIGVVVAHSQYSTRPLPHTNNNLSLSAQLWESNLHIANQVLASPFIRAIAAGVLPPDVYGSFIVQDIFYCANAQEDYVTGIKRVQNDPLRRNLTAFLLGEYEGYIVYNKAYFDTWRISNHSCIVPKVNTTLYVDLERDIAVNYAPELLVIVMTPCLVLWDWLGRQLIAEGVKSTNPYYSFVSYMMDGAGVQKFNNYIDYLAPSIDVELAASVYKSAMMGELGMFLEGFHTH